MLAYYKFYRLNVENWADRITGDVANATSLETVFRDHPEFFQITTDGTKSMAALVARRSFTRSYDVDVGTEISKNEAMERRGNEQAWQRISRRPLTPDEVAVLIKTAIDMHDRAVQQRNAGRWWVLLASSGIGLIGGILATLGGVWIAKVLANGS
ncbi:MAG: N-carbamoyl-L-amino acid amidohydrolase [Geminicoccaceae bacterium]